MAISAAMVKELREKSGAGMVDCKNALTATEGDLEKAMEFLREKGLAAAAKKSGRIAAEGLVMAFVSDDGARGSIVEVNSETDFVGKNQDFRTFVEQVAQLAMKSPDSDMESFVEEPWINGDYATIKEALTNKIAVIGENLSIRRKQVYVKQGGGAVVPYIHGGGRVAVLIELVCDKASDAVVEAGKNLAMQIAAMSPKFVNRGDVPQDFIDKEREILKQQALNEGKPEKIVEKMVEGRLTKALMDFCLLEQEYVKDGELSVAKYLEAVGKEVGAPVSVKHFVRYETGEGIEKKEENFAEEVSKAMQG
ncbi:MAG: translation elongation factor Ts [Defluviitaleaceae bacterium]|nr:translation elongation factor Ts [Defluviitaleaceae bacterium]